MMRPMKLAGSELMFGEGCLEYIKTIKVCLLYTSDAADE